MSLVSQISAVITRIATEIKAEKIAREEGDVVKAVLDADDPLPSGDPGTVVLRRGVAPATILDDRVIDHDETPPYPGVWLRRPAP